ncbi:MAG: hypothetical protein QQN40_07705, partial [Nitrosopumilus sp.]
AQFESETIYHSIRKDLEDKGVIFTDTDTALKEHEELVKKYFGKIVPPADNKFSALNTAVWSGGSFIYVPKGVKVDLPLQAYFRINAKNMGQFERTLIITDEGSELPYIEGCLPEGEEVLTGEKIVPVTSIERGMEVMNSDGNKTTVEKTMKRKYSGDLVVMEPWSRGNKFELTSEHPVLAV